MTLLLKSMWQNVFRSNAFNKPILLSRALSTSVAEVPRGTPDAIAARLRAAPSPAAVLAAVTAHLPAMTHKHMLLALRCLFELQRDGKFTDDGESLVKDPAFSVLCQNFKKHARSLDTNDAIDAIKALTYLNVPVDSLIVQTMLQIVRCNINFLNLRQIMFLDFILGRFDTKNHLVDALKLALPLAFQIHLPLELDNQDLPLLRDMLAFCCTHDMPDRCINNVVTGLLLHDQSIDAHTAKAIIGSLCLINCTEEMYSTRVQLLHICYDILTQNIDRLSYEDVLKTVARIKGRVLEKHPEFYHEQLMDAIANYVIQNNLNFENGLLIARVLSRIAHTHLGLVEHLCNLAASEPDTLSNARTNIIFGFINCLANNNYTPEAEQWNELKKQISENPIFDAKNFNLPWAKVCLELASLGYYNDKLLERVFSQDFLDHFLIRDDNKLDYLQLLTLNEAVQAFHSGKYRMPDDVLRKARSLYPVHALSEPLQETLARGLGLENCVGRDVVLPNGIIADALVCLKGGQPVKLPAVTGKRLTIDQLKLPPGGIVVCILNFNHGCFSMNSNRLRGPFRLMLDILEKQGYAALSINVNEWLHMPAHERVPYLMREVNYKCGEIGMKLTAT